MWTAYFVLQGRLVDDLLVKHVLLILFRDHIRQAPSSSSKAPGACPSYPSLLWRSQDHYPENE